MRMLIAMAIICFVASVPENGVGQGPKKEKTPVVRVLKGWSLEKLGGDEESVTRRGNSLGWPGVGVVYKSLDEVAKPYPDKKFLQKLDKEVDFSKNILLRYSWGGAGPPVSYLVWESKEGPIVLFQVNRLRDPRNTGSLELIIPADVYKRSIERDRSADFRYPLD